MGAYQPKEELQVLPEDQELEETILKRIIPSEDGRTPVNQTTEWPYRFNGQLDIKFSFGTYGGSGVIVGPQHILTAAHNVYNSKDKGKEPREWARSIMVRLGLNNAVEPYGAISAIRFYTFNAWIEKKDPNYDLALLVLENAIGLTTGWSGLLAATDKDLQSHQVSITGYPYDKGFKQMWTMTHILKHVFPERFVYEIDTGGGQSGSGIMLEKWSSPYVVGVMGIGNAGCRLSYAKAKQIIQWIEETMSIKQDISNVPYSIDVISELNDRLATPAEVEGPYDALIALLGERYNHHHRREEEMSPKRGRRIAKGIGIARDELKDCKEKANDAVNSNIVKSYKLQMEEKQKEYFKSANQGHAGAQYNVGNMYYKGDGVVKDYTIAREWFEKAAEQGHARAQYNVGNMYYNGDGVDKDDKKAFEWFQKAADQGHVQAQFNLGVMYEKGVGVKMDLTKAVAYYGQAANQGHIKAQYNVGNMYYNGDGVDKDYAKAVAYYGQAASQGHVKAQYNLGNMYYNGDGIEKNYAKARECYQKAARQQNADAQVRLGVIYYNGHGVTQNYTKAVAYYGQAAHQGHAGAQYNVGNMYYNGDGVDKDDKKAFEWFQKAANQGDAQAQFSLCIMYVNGKGVDKDDEKAFEWCQKAADQGHVQAQFNLGVMYEKGVGVKMDLTKAKEWYQRAVNQGDARQNHQPSLFPPIVFDFMQKEGYSDIEGEEKQEKKRVVQGIEGDIERQEKFKQKKVDENDSILYSIIFKEILPHIFSFLSLEDSLKIRLVNRDFDEYIKMALQAYLKNTFILKEIDEAIDFKHKNLRGLRPELIIISGLHKSMKHVKNLPPALWPYLAETDIHTLDLGNNEIGPIKIKKLAKNLQHTKVQEINLSGNNMGDTGLDQLVKYLEKTNLKKINLSNNNIGDIGAVGFAKCLKLKEAKICTLDLSYNNMGDIGINRFAKYLIKVGIQKVILTGNKKISLNKKDELRKQYSNITWEF
jgi:TPR repeat protein/V8-like Glu-specific endopeptidase